MHLENYKEQLKSKILNRQVTNYDKGLSEDGTTVIADYPVLEKVLEHGGFDPNGTIDLQGDLTELENIQQELKKTHPFIKTTIRYIPKRTMIYNECCRELNLSFLL